MIQELRRWIGDQKELLPLYGGLLLLIFLFAHYNPSLLSFSSFQQLSLQFLPLIAASIAQAVVMLTGGIDLAMGSVISLVTAIVATTMSHSIFFAVASSLLAGCIVGASTGSIVVLGRLPAIIVTLAASFVWSGVALFILPEPGGNVAPQFMAAMNGSVGPLPVPFLIIVGIMVLWKYVKLSPLGLEIYATGGNAQGAFFSGINTTRAKLFAYTLAGFFTAVGGIGLVGLMGSGDPTVGAPYTLNAIAAAVLGGVSFAGGVGKMRGVLAGALLLGILTNVLFFSGLSPFYQYVVRGLILIVAVGLNRLRMVGVSLEQG